MMSSLLTWASQHLGCVFAAALGMFWLICGVVVVVFGVRGAVRDPDDEAHLRDIRERNGEEE